MQIIKILNNNVVISEENQEEIVLMGRGLAFGRKAGQEIPLDLIEKKFILSADRKQLINEIDPEIIEIAGEVIAFAHKKISKKLNHHVFIAMADHMHGVALREKDDIYLKNFLMWDIKRFFPEEFEVGKYANQLLSQYFGKDLPDDEAGFMALTIVNA
ncbi:Transcription antiterminator LicT [Streptococcus gordonii]|nr:Transcription antiterminator LicT [Streptococcus gordonii]